MKEISNLIAYRPGGLMILELKNIYKEYQQGKLVVPVLKHVDFSMEEGEYVAIMELLDAAEPVLSQYEIELLEKELHVYSEVLAKTETIDQFRNMYIDLWRKQEVCYTL